MNKPSLFNQLRSAYSEENLRKITTRIIEAYRKKENRYLQELYERAENTLGHNEMTSGKIFSRLVQLYHPDRLAFYLNELTQYEKNPREQLLSSLSHILFTLENLGRRPSSAPDDFMESYLEDTGYGFDEDEFDHVMNHDDFEDEWSGGSSFEDDEDERFKSNDFFSVLQRAEYAQSGIRISAADLAKLQGDLNLAETDMDDLSGVEKCRHISSLDISGNQLDDIAPLGFLTELEELYIGGNDVTDLKPISKLQKLKNLDLSFNGLNDIKVLLDLVALKYVNLIGNSIPAKQIEELKKRGVLVVT